MRGADINFVPPPTPRGRSISSVRAAVREDSPVTTKDSRDLLRRSRSRNRDDDMSQDQMEAIRAALLQLYAMQQIAMKQAQGKASRSVRRVDERLALTM